MTKVKCDRCGKEVREDRTVAVFGIAGTDHETVCTECWYKELAKEAKRCDQ